MPLKLPPGVELPQPEPVEEVEVVADTKKKKEKKEKVYSSELAVILAAIRKDKGDKVVIKGSEVAPVTRIPTGLFELDFNLGGGFPRGRYSIVYGPESSNKTNICLKAIAQAQKLPPPCNVAVWVNIEKTFDPKWAAKMGVDTENLLLVNPGYGEEAVDLVDALIRGSEISMLVVDSMAPLIASKEIAKSTEDYDIGTSALLIKRMVNKLMIAFDECSKREHYPCVILVNQTRFKPGVIYGDPETMPGGEAQKFLASLRIRTYCTNEIDKASNQIIWKDTRVIVKKAKIPVRAINFSFKMCMWPMDGVSVGQTDSFLAVKNLLQSKNFLEKTNKGYELKHFEGDDIWYFDTLSEIKEKYQTSPEFCHGLQNMVNGLYTEEIVADEPDFEVPPEKITPGKISLYETFK